MGNRIEDFCTLIAVDGNKKGKELGSNPIPIPVRIPHLPSADPFRRRTLIRAVNDGAIGSGMTSAITVTESLI